MLFTEFLTGLSQQGGSVRAYDKCAREARGRIAGEPENAAALLLIAYAAQHFVDAYDDQPLTGRGARQGLFGRFRRGQGCGPEQGRRHARLRVAELNPSRV